MITGQAVYDIVLKPLPESFLIAAASERRRTFIESPTLRYFLRSKIQIVRASFNGDWETCSL